MTRFETSIIKLPAAAPTTATSTLLPFWHRVLLPAFGRRTPATKACQHMLAILDCIREGRHRAPQVDQHFPRSTMN